MKQVTNKSLLLTNETSKRLLYRIVERSDFETWLKFCEDETSLQYIWQSENETPEEKCKGWFDRVFHRYENDLGGMNALIDKVTNQYIGQCGLLIQKVDNIRELEVGYSMMPEHRGKGYAIEAAMKCRDFAFENDLCDSLISTIHVDNEKSANVALKNGMELDKKTIYMGNPVNIYRITKAEWIQIKHKSVVIV